MNASSYLQTMFAKSRFSAVCVPYFVALPFLIIPSSAHAFESIGISDTSSFSASGFGTLGLARASNDNAQYIRDVTQPNGVGKNWSGLIDSLVGLQANYRYNEPTVAIIQAVSHYRYDGSFSPELTRALIRYEWTPRVTLRVGRIGTEFLMQSDSRMVGYSYLTVRPNPDFFGGVPINYADGIDIGYHMPFTGGNLEGSVFSGLAREDVNLYPLHNSHVKKVTLGFSKSDWQMRYLYGQVKLANNLDVLNTLETTLVAYGATGSAGAFDLAGCVDQYNSLGAMYDNGVTQVQAGYSIVTHQNVVYENAKSWFVLIGVRQEKVTPFAGYSSVKSSPKNFDSGNPILNSLIQPALTGSHQEGHTLTLGARWDVAHDIDIKSQVDFIRGGSAASILLYDNVKPSWDGRMTVYSLAMDFVF